MPFDGKLIMPEAEQPTFPNTAVQVTQQGVMISVNLAPGISINAALNEETMNQMTDLWMQSRQAKKQELAIVQHITRTRND